MEKHLLALRPETLTNESLTAKRQIPKQIDKLRDLINIECYYEWCEYSNGYEPEEEINYYENSYKFVDISTWRGLNALIHVIKCEMEKLGIIGKTNINQRVVVYDKRYNAEKYGGFYSSEYNCIYIANEAVTDAIETGKPNNIDITNNIKFLNSLSHELCHSFQDTTMYIELNKLGYWMNPLEIEAYNIGDKIVDLYSKFNNGECGEYDVMFTELNNAGTITIA